ncbi:hypothetical protein LINGRAHAP2_LOCUS34685, partial [Linum grandiflorum]
ISVLQLQARGQINDKGSLIIWQSRDLKRSEISSSNYHY